MAPSIGSVVGSGRGTSGSTQRGRGTTSEPRTQARVYAMTQRDVQETPTVVTCMM